MNLKSFLAKMAKSPKHIFQNILFSSMEVLQVQMLLQITELFKMTKNGPINSNIFTSVNGNNGRSDIFIETSCNHLATLHVLLEIVVKRQRVQLSTREHGSKKKSEKLISTFSITVYLVVGGIIQSVREG